MNAIETLAAIVESSNDAIVGETLDGTITSWNPSAEQLFGYGTDEILGRHVSVLAGPGRENEMHETLARLRRGEKVEHYETIRRRKDGSLVDVSLSLSPIRDRAGQVVGAAKIARDVTERRRADDALRKRALRFDRLANAVPVIIWTAGPDGVITFANDRCFEFCGVAPDRNARDWPELVPHADDRERCAEEWHRAWRDGTEYRIEVRNRHHDGAYHWCLTRAIPSRDDQGRIVEWFGVTTDIHECKQAEEEQRLLAAELAHRAQNILAVVQVLAGRTAKGATSIEAYLEAFRGRLRALSAAHRALTAGEWQDARLSEIVSAALEPYARDGERISLQIEDVALEPKVVLTLSLALHELVTNAAKYGALSGSSGRVTVSARIEPDESGGVLRLVWQEDAGRPVQPPGTPGFGLSMLRQAIEYQHAGRVELVWRDQGLLCRMTLPLDTFQRGPAKV